MARIASSSSSSSLYRGRLVPQDSFPRRLWLALGSLFLVAFVVIQQELLLQFGANSAASSEHSAGTAFSKPFQPQASSVISANAQEQPEHRNNNHNNSHDKLASSASASPSAVTTSGEHHNSVVDAVFVHQLLVAASSSALGSDLLLVLFCGDASAFQQGHIPWATHLVEAQTGFKDGVGMMELSAFQQLVHKLQLTAERTVVFYDDNMNLNAVRAWWVFQHFGYPKTRLKVLGGGWQAWLHGNFPVATHDSAAAFPSLSASATLFAPSIGQDVIDFQHLLPLVSNRKEEAHPLSVQFVDARSLQEFTRGHLPRAVSFEWTEAINTSDHGPPVFLAPTILQHKLTTRGFVVPRVDGGMVVTYCQRGIRGTFVAFVLQEVLGLHHVRLYENSMMEYMLQQPPAPLDSSSSSTVST